MSDSVFVEFRLMSSVASNRCPFRTFLSLGNRKKSDGARSGEYGGCCNWAVPCLANNCCTRCEVCAGALSWCRIQSPSRHFSGRFGRTDSRKRRKTCTQNSLLIAYSRCAIPSESKNSINMTFVLLRTWRPFFGREDVGRKQSNATVRPIASSPYACCNTWYVSFAGFFICDFKTKLDANALFGSFTHRKNRYDINARVTSATYCCQLNKRSHLQLVSWLAKTRTDISRLVANTSHPVNNHYNSNPDTI